MTAANQYDPPGRVPQSVPTVPSEPSSLQPQVEGKEALRDLRKLVRSLAEPARSDALARIAVVSRELPRKRQRRTKSDAQFRKGLRSMMVAYAIRVGDSDWDGDLADMGDDVSFFAEQLGNAVRARNASGRHSWPAIGRVFGISAQAAHKKWHRTCPIEPSDEGRP